MPHVTQVGGANLIITTRVSHVLQLVCMSITFKNNLLAPPEEMSEIDGSLSLIWGVLPLPPVCLQLPPKSCCQDRDCIFPLHMNLIFSPSKPQSTHVCCYFQMCPQLESSDFRGKKTQNHNFRAIRAQFLFPSISFSICPSYLCRQH